MVENSQTTNIAKTCLIDVYHASTEFYMDTISKFQLAPPPESTMVEKKTTNIAK